MLYIYICFTYIYMFYIYIYTYVLYIYVYVLYILYICYIYIYICVCVFPLFSPSGFYCRPGLETFQDAFQRLSPGHRSGHRQNHLGIATRIEVTFWLFNSSLWKMMENAWKWTMYRCMVDVFFSDLPIKKGT